MIPLRDLNPSRTTPYLVYAAIVACVAVFVWQIRVGLPQSAFLLGAIPAQLFEKTGVELPIAVESPVEPWVTLFSSMFMHGSIMHLAGNMLFLWVFGDNIEDAMGHFRFIVFYLLCGLAAALGHAALHPDSAVPMIGASGAISGVLGGYLLLYPRAQVMTLIPIFFLIRIVPLPAWLWIGFWIVGQTVSGVASYTASTGAASGVAYFAHIGGFVAGVILVRFFIDDSRLRAPPAF